MALNSTAAPLTALVGGTFFDDFYGNQEFMVEPVSSWNTEQILLFPWLFIIPAEILGMISTTLIMLIGSSPWGFQLLGDNDLPHGKRTAKPLAMRDWCYIYFNRLVVLPFISWMIVTCVWNSDAVVYDMDKLNWMNGLVMFVVVFSLSDFTYYASHRIVHSVPAIYKFVHKHHHGESEPIRGWADTCNAHPTDFFYTGFCTSPMSVLWLMPAGSVHIVAIGACLWVNSFVGSLGHTRLDFSVGIPGVAAIFNTRFHAGHHGYAKCNFAQNIELWDRIFGTFRDYSSTVDKKLAEKAK